MESSENFKVKTHSVTIDNSTSDFKNMDNKRLSEYNLQEIRGWIIDKLNEIEEKIDNVIVNFFNPEKKTEFKTIVLNTSILSTGSKMKVLRNIEGFEKKIIGDLQKIISIRNAFAHIPTTRAASITIKNEGGRLKMTLENVETRLDVMNSSGDIKSRAVKDLISEFDTLTIYISQYLDSFAKS